MRKLQFENSFKVAENVALKNQGLKKYNFDAPHI
jgi:hypothetical protein